MNRMVIRFVFLILISCLVFACQPTESSDTEVIDEVIPSPKSQLDIDIQAIQKYLSKNNLEAVKTESGLFYSITEFGDGEPVSEGSTVDFHIMGKFLNGVQFYSSYESGQFIEVIIGQKMVVPGVEEGLQLLKAGGKATLYIPSPLAYGLESSGSQVPPNAIIIHQIEVIAVN